MRRNHPIIAIYDRMLVSVGTHAALIALLALCTGSASCSFFPFSELDPNAARVGGPLTVDGPLVVRGAVTVGGPCVVHGQVHAAGLTVGGPVYTLPSGEKPGPAGETFASSLSVGGPLIVNGPLIAGGKLTVGGPFTSELSQNVEGEDVRLGLPLTGNQTLIYQPQTAPQPQLQIPPQPLHGQGQPQLLSEPGDVTE